MVFWSYIISWLAVGGIVTVVFEYWKAYNEGFDKKDLLWCFIGIVLGYITLVVIGGGLIAVCGGDWIENIKYNIYQRKIRIKKEKYDKTPEGKKAKYEALFKQC